MPTSTGQRLEVLALLQAHPGTSADRLAARLAVTQRTARRDVAHLRDLGYRIDAEPGRFGGYRLAPGTSMPPLGRRWNTRHQMARQSRPAAPGTGPGLRPAT